MRGFLLGLANGPACLTACVPVLVSLVLSEGKKASGSALLLASFLAGRLAGYLAFAVVAWGLGHLLSASLPGGSPWTHRIEAGSFVILGALLLAQGFGKPAAICAARVSGGLLQKLPAGGAPLLPAALGLLTGLNLCPPFLLAITEGALKGSLLGSLLFFLSFYLGTTVFFLPLPLLGALHRRPEVRTVGRITSVLLGGYYCVLGVIMLRSLLI